MKKKASSTDTMATEVPEDLGVKIGSMEEELWTQVRDEAKALIDNHEKSLIIQKAMFDLAVKKIAEEKEKFK